MRKHYGHRLAHGIAVLLVLSLVLLASDGFAARTLALVKDINQEAASAQIGRIAVMGGFMYFGGNDGLHGVELMRSDGTAAGTSLVLDINPGLASGIVTSEPFAVMNNVLYFVADDGVNGKELWRSDGTAAGTAMVKDIAPGAASANPYQLTVVNGQLFFGADDGVNGIELWKSDGTAAGTVMVKDIWSGGPTGSSTPYYLTAVNTTLFFTANDPATGGNELWKSDGTAIGTVRINFGVTNPFPDSLTSVSGVLFFAANDGTGSVRLWRSDGTDAGTVNVPLSYLGYQATNPVNLINGNGTLYFRADEPMMLGSELWKYDGVAAAAPVKDIYTGSLSASPSALNFVNGILYFSAYDAGDIPTFGLWKSDGTAAGTTKIANGRFSGGIVNYGGALLLGFDTGSVGEELYTSDGSATMTLVKDINPTAPDGPAGSNIASMTLYNGKVYFTADDGVHGVNLWTTDGTTAGTVTVPVNRFGTLASSSGPAVLINGAMYFAANNGINGTELWKSDGTAAGTVMVNDINQTIAADGSPGGGNPQNLTNVNGTLFFTADDGVNGAELWKTDGTAAGTVMVKDINSVTGPSDPYNLANVNGTLFFSAFDGVSRELWKSDGTAAGTVMVKDINTSMPGAGSNPSYLVNMNGTLFFAADDGLNGTELWKSDGTDAGTVMVKDINTSLGIGSNPSSLLVVAGQLYFAASDGVNGAELWKSDGTAAGTVMVKDINAGAGSSWPSSLTNVNGTLFFLANDGIAGVELWKSDGTAAGTAMVKDIYSGAASSWPDFLTNVNGTLFFAADDGVNGVELWKSDGTDAGTSLVKDINPGLTGSLPNGLYNLNGTLYFSADDGTHGAELWQSDGTAAGTMLVGDINPVPGAGSTPQNLIGSGPDLFFSADDGQHGAELMALIVVSPTATPQTTSVTENGTLAITLSGTDPDGMSLAYAVATSPANGTITGTAPNLVYTPATGFVGADSFTFTVTNGVKISTAATVGITVNQRYQSVTFAAGPNGTLSGTASQLIPWNGSSSAITAVPDSGHHFVGWSGTGGFTAVTNPLTLAAVIADMSITATFAINTYSVTASAGPNGSLSVTTPSPVTINHGSTSSFTFDASGGYHVASVIDTCGGAGYSNTLNDVTSYTYATPAVTAACAVSATFSRTPDGILVPAPGKVSPELTDALKALKISVGMAQPTPFELVRGDVAPLVNGVPQPDGRITLGDAVVLLRRAVGLIAW